MTGQDPMRSDPLRASEAARQLGVPTREVIRMMYAHELRYVMVDGIAHVPQDALDEHQTRAT